MKKRLAPTLLSVLLLTVGNAIAAPPRTLGYQGVLTDAQGGSVADGAYSMTFRIYAVASGGSALWSETQNVTVSGGRFDVILGSVAPLTIPFDDPYWLGLEVDADGEMSPRTELAGAPYSQIARSVEDGAITSGKIAGNTVVRSLNGLDDAVGIVGGTNVTVTPVGNDLEISATGGGTPPGVASAQGVTSGVLTGPGTTDILVTRSITCPSDGYVLVIASAHVFLNHTSGNPTWARVGTSDTSASIPSNQQISAQIAHSAATGSYVVPLTSHGLYAVSAGSNTFYPLGEKGINGTASVGDIQLSIVYFETAYGSVVPTVVAGEGSSSRE